MPCRGTWVFDQNVPVSVPAATAALSRTSGVDDVVLGWCT